MRTFVKRFTGKLGTFIVAPSVGSIMRAERRADREPRRPFAAPGWQPPRNDREAKDANVFHFPHHSDRELRSQNSAERWARLESKSDAMVDDVLAACGAVERDSVCNPSVRLGQLAVFAVLCLSAMAFVAAIAIFSFPPLRPEFRSPNEQVASGNSDQSPDEQAPPFWEPFRP
jgi:hypothetical protein